MENAVNPFYLPCLGPQITILQRAGKKAYSFPVRNEMEGDTTVAGSLHRVWEALVLYPQSERVQSHTPYFPVKHHSPEAMATRG